MSFLAGTGFAQGGYLRADFGSANDSEDSFEDSDTGFDFFGGTRFNESFGIELS